MKKLTGLLFMLLAILTIASCKKNNNVDNSNSTNTKQYVITFKNEDGTTLQSSYVKEGNTPVFTSTAPTKDEDVQYTYTFSGWDKTLEFVTQNTTYTAVFEETNTSSSYTVNFINYNGETL